MEAEDIGLVLEVLTVQLGEKDVHPMNSQRKNQIFDHVELTDCIPNVHHVYLSKMLK